MMPTPAADGTECRQVSCEYVEEKGREKAMNSPTILIFGERLTTLHRH
jgi:hypothetical protein